MWKSSKGTQHTAVAVPARVRLPRVTIGVAAMRRTGALLTFLLLWHLVVVTGLVNQHIVPTPAAVVVSFVDLTLDWSEFARHNLQRQLVLSAGLSVSRVAAGLALGIVLGIAAGFLIAWFPLWAFPADFMVRVLRTIPGMAWVPLAIAWFGVGFFGPVFIVTNTVIFPIVIATIHGVRTVNPVYIQALRTLGANDRTVMRDVVLPSAVPSILTGVRVSMSIGWWSVIAAEMFGATGGLGYSLKYYGEAVQMPEVMALMAAIGMIALVLDRGYVAVQRRLLAWQGPRESIYARGG